MLNKEILLPSCSQGVQLAENERLITIGLVETQITTDGDVITVDDGPFLGYLSPSSSVNYSEIGFWFSSTGKISSPYTFQVLPNLSISLQGFLHEEKGYFYCFFGFRANPGTFPFPGIIGGVTLTMNRELSVYVDVDLTFDDYTSTISSDLPMALFLREFSTFQWSEIWDALKDGEASYGYIPLKKGLPYSSEELGSYITSEDVGKNLILGIDWEISGKE